jgi:hypothetical protein
MWLSSEKLMAPKRENIQADTEMKNFPVFCPKCKKETLINVKEFRITVIHEPAAKPQS